MIIDDVAQSIRRIAYAIPNLEYLPEDHNTSIVKDDITINNEMWSCAQLRKIHLETCKTKYLDVLHCVFFPDFEYPIPIFGADIIATPQTVTAAIVDVSPVNECGNIYASIEPLCNSYNFTHKRPLPLWGEIFSPWCKFQRLHLASEQQDFINLVNNILMISKSSL